MNYPALLHVFVKLEDIALGRVGNCIACPIARVLRRMGYTGFTVNENWIEFHDGAKYVTSPQAREFICRYDNVESVRSCDLYFRRVRLPHYVEAPATGAAEVALG